MIGVLVKLRKLDMVVEKENASEDLGIQDVDLLELGFAAQQVLPNSNGHRKLVASDRESQRGGWHLWSLLGENQGRRESGLDEYSKTLNSRQALFFPYLLIP